MHHRIVLRALGLLIAIIGVLALVPAGVAWHVGESLRPWLSTAWIGMGVGGGFWWLGRRARDTDLGIREGFAITTLAWALGSLVSAIGIWFAVPGTSFLDAWFEMISGFTTTGASIFGIRSDGSGVPIADLGAAVHVWRATSQLLGGLGIVVISLALLPAIASGGGYQLYRTEVTGLQADRLAPRIVDTARILLSLYSTLLLLSVAALVLAGVTPIDAFCHAASAISTGGFSTYDNSVDGLGNHAAEWILILIMAASGLNFVLLITAVRGRPRSLWASEEARLFLGILLGAWLLEALLVGLTLPSYDGHLTSLLRDCLFQVVSIATSTGFATGFAFAPGGWEGWIPPAQLVLLLLMLGGGCAGSTAGGTKLVRLLLITRLLRRELRRNVEPNRVSPILLDGRSLTDSQILRVTGFLAAYAFSWLAGSMLLCLTGLDLPSAGSAALTSLSNIGPGVGQVGIAHSFGELPAAAKSVCMLLMLLGRLEFFGVLYIMMPRHWLR